MLSAPTREIASPVPELPVKLITGTSGDSIKSFDAAEPLSVTTLITPFGNDFTSEKIFDKKAFTCAVCEGNFTTVVVPAAKAGASERIINTTGEFHGAITPATPIGSRKTMEKLPAFGSSARPYSVRTSDAE